MRFKNFLPDLSLAFIIWSFSMLLFAVAVWIFIFWLPKKIKPLRALRFEYMLIWLASFALIFFVLRTVLNDFLLSKYTALTVSVVLSTFIVYIVGKFADYEKILQEVNLRITPLIWLFTLLLIAAVPLSVLEPEAAHSDKVSFDSHPAGLSDIKRPNIILVTMDALTAMDMSAYGYGRNTTPFITEWAKDAVLFEKTYASSNWTTPSAMSLMTGQRPWTHKLWFEPQYHVVDKYENNMPQILKNYGYSIYGFVQNNLAHPKTLGIDDAFSISDEAYTFFISDKRWMNLLTRFYYNRRIAAELVIENNLLFKPLNLKHTRHPSYMRLVIYSGVIRAEPVYDRFFNYISQSHKGPFFAWIHLLPPHDLYLPPDQYIGKFGNHEAFETGEKQLDSDLLYSHYAPKRQGDVDILRSRYDEFILYSDQQFKLFMSRLAETIDVSNTIIILSADHGESFSHGYVAHNGAHLYEPLVRVPLMIKVPNISGGRSVNIPVEQIDIAPTILDLVSIPVPEWMEGRSLLPLMENKTFTPRPIFSMQLIENRQTGKHPLEGGTIAVWDGGYKFVDYFGKERALLLFNLDQDPNEENNLIDEKPEIAIRLKKLIDSNLDLANQKIAQHSER